MIHPNRRVKESVLFLTFFIFAFSLFLSEIANAKILSVGIGKSFSTIQSAVNAAKAGDVVEVAPGIYKESVVINKLITLVGSKAGKSVISGGAADYIVKIESANGVVLDNLEIDGGDAVSKQNVFNYGILVNNSGDSGKPIQIKNTRIKNIWKEEGTSIGIEGKSYALISKNKINSFYKNGVRFVDSRGKIYSNTIEGEGVDGINRVQNLVNLRANSNAEIYDNMLVGGFTMAPSPETLYSPCIFVNAYPGNATSYAFIHDNDISLCDVGVIIGTKLIDTDSSSAKIIRNNFHDLYLGVSFQQETNYAELQSNSFENVSNADNRTVMGLEEKGEWAQATNSGLLAGAFSTITLGTNNNLVGLIVALAALFLLGFLAKKYI